MKLIQSTVLLLVFVLVTTHCQQAVDGSEPQWPEITKESKPWTRWWWHGSAVSKEGITSELERMNEVGIGGVEITPIFGVKGEEEKFIDFLTPEWMEMLLHTLKEAERLGMGVDMATGTGWPFGGPWIGAENAPKNIEYKTFTLEGGQQLSEPITFLQQSMVRATSRKVSIDEIKYPISANTNLQKLALDQVKFEKELPLVTLMAYNEAGESLNLTEKVADGKLDWIAPEGNWTLYAVFQGLHGKMVERAAPGGEGNVIDHFSSKALEVYLAKFDSAFAGQDITALRAFFNDSYEVDDARGEGNWTPGFFEVFEKEMGYDLQDNLPALFGKADQETNERVLSDYRSVIETLIYENFTKKWQKWGAGYGKIIRNQAHGSPANILDLYATVDIPETEGTEMLKIKFASSASNVTGKKLTSSESATWLNDHFQSSLADVRHNLERYELGGVNHIFYHGTAYSPADDLWPGWLFYAAVHFNDRNPFWKDLGKLDQYMTRIQSFMQSSQTDNDILVYFPIYDRYAEGGHGLLEHFDIRGNFNKSQVKMIGEELMDKGYSFDLISDKQISQLTASETKIKSQGGADYEVLLVPKTRYIPLETMEKLLELAENGTKIVFHEDLPQSVPGMANLDDRQSQLEKIKVSITAKSQVDGDLDKLLADVTRETLIGDGVEVLRKTHASGHYYFIVNWGDGPIDGFVPLAKATETMAIFNPMTEVKGLAKVNDGSVYLQLAPGESCIVMTSEKGLSDQSYPYYEAGATISIDEKWDLVFERGGPELPEPVTGIDLMDWTQLDDPKAKAFSGTGVYTTNFKLPEGQADAYRLDLGEVRESAVIILNGEKVGTLIGPSYQIDLPAELMKESNELKIEVSNLMANRIIDLEKKGIEYRKFYNTNFPANKSENRGEDGLFTAISWTALPSGLIGPLTIRPLNTKIKF